MGPWDGDWSGVGCDSMIPSAMTGPKKMLRAKFIVVHWKLSSLTDVLAKPLFIPKLSFSLTLVYNGPRGTTCG